MAAGGWNPNNGLLANFGPSGSSDVPAVGGLKSNTGLLANSCPRSNAGGGGANIEAGGLNPNIGLLASFGPSDANDVDAVGGAKPNTGLVACFCVRSGAELLLPMIPARVLEELEALESDSNDVRMNSRLDSETARSRAGGGDGRRRV